MRRLEVDELNRVVQAGALQGYNLRVATPARIDQIPRASISMSPRPTG